MAQPGEIYRHGRFYLDEHNKWQPKYFVFLAEVAAGDLAIRLLTSRQRDRPRDPPCFHGDPLPGYFLGMVGDPLNSESWVDLRASDDYDGRSFAEDLGAGILQRVTGLPTATLRSLLDCAARAPDTTVQQSRAMRDRLSSMPVDR